MKEFRALVYTVVSSNAWKKDKVCLLKKIKLQWKTLRHKIDTYTYRRKKHIEHATAVQMTVQLGKTFKDPLDGHNLMG